MVPLQGVVLANDALVDIGDEKQKGQDCKGNAGTDRDSGDPVSRLLAETEFGRALVNNGQCTDSTGDQEEEGRGVDSPGDRIDPHVDDSLDEHEDGSTKDSRDERGHDKTSEDGTKTLATCSILSAGFGSKETYNQHTIPTPLNTFDTNSGNTDTSNRGNERVGRRHMGIVSCAPHDPDRCTSSGTSEGEKLDRSVTLEGGEGNDSVLDGRSGSCTDSKCTRHFEYQTQELFVMN